MRRIALWFWMFTAPAWAGVLDPTLVRVLEQARPKERIPVLIRMTEQADAARLRRETAGFLPAARRTYVVRTLRALARRTQARLRARVEVARQRGEVGDARFLWLANAVFLEATPALIREIAPWPEVATITWDPPVPALDLEKPTVPADHTEAPPRTAIAWGVRKIRAPAVWDTLGFTGQGVVVGLIDTGVNYNHPDLQGQMWTNPGEIPNNGIDDDNNGYVDDYYGYDFAENDPIPMDDHGHGTHTAGTIAGNGASGVQTGVAPGARIMALKSLIQGAGPESYSIEAAQYALMMGANLCSMSLGWTWPNSSDRSTWRTAIENLAAGGVAFVKSAGNRGNALSTYPVPHNLSVPGGVPVLVAVAATDSNDLRAYYSSIGPTVWDYPDHNAPPYDDWPYPPGYPKPEVAAPGVEVLSLDYTGGYTLKSGTSMAAPHVAGVLALMLEAAPFLTVEQLKTALLAAAVDLGPEGPDSLFGTGRVDAYQAVVQALAQSGDPTDPRPPQNLAAYSDYTTPTSMTLTWQDPVLYINGDTLGNHLSHILIYQITETGDTVEVGQVAAGVQSFVHTGLTDGTVYTYTLRAVDDRDSTSPYAAPAAWYAGGSPWPAPPSDLQASVMSETTVVALWQDPTTQADGTPLDDLAGIYVWVNDQLADSVAPGIQMAVLTVPPGPVTLTLRAYDNETPRHLSDPVSTEVVTTVHAGGPDGFGYRYADSRYWGPVAPGFQWLEISGLGTGLPLTDDDVALISLPFGFPYYEDTLTSLYVCSNGFLETSSDHPYANDPLPIANLENLILPFWDDLNPASGGQVFWWASDSMVVVEWQAVPHFGGGGPYTFEVILYPNGQILFQYLDMNQPTNSATVGIQGGHGFNGYYLQYSYNGDPTEPTDSLAVLFYPEATQVGEGPGTVLPRLRFLPPRIQKGRITIRLEVPREGTYRLEIYDATGRRVGSLYRGRLTPGLHRFTWQPPVASGVYFLRLSGSPGVRVQKVWRTR